MLIPIPFLFKKYYAFKFLEHQNTDTVDGAIWNMPKMTLNFAENHKGNQEFHINTSDYPIKQEIQRGKLEYNKAQMPLAGLLHLDSVS